MAEQRRLAVNKMGGPPIPRPASAAVALTPKEVFGILRRHVLLIVSLTILGFIIGGAAWYLLKRYTPKYTAQTFIRVLSPVERDPMTIGGGMAAKDIQYGYRVSMAALIKQQGTLEKLLGRDKIRETRWFERFGDIKRERYKCIRKAFKDLKKRFGASPQRDSDYIQVSMTCRYREEAALIVNEMVDLFVTSRGITKRAEISDKLTELESQRRRVQRDLDSAEDALEDTRSRWGFTDLEERQFQHTITLRLNDLELEQNKLTLEIQGLRTGIESLKMLAVGPVNEQIERQIELDPVMVMLAQQLAFRESEIAGMLIKFGENHRVVREAQELINATQQERQIRKAEIAEQTRRSNLQDAQDGLLILQSRLVELRRMYAEATARKRDLDSARVQYQQRVTIRDERKGMLDSIKSQIDKLKIIHDDPETPKVQFVGAAPVPLYVSFPKRRIFFPGGTVLGLLFGAGLAFLIELLNDLVRTPRDVVRYLHIPLLGVIPDASEDEQARDVDLCHVVRQAPYSIVSESYRRFRTNLKLSGLAQSKVLLITSGMAEDGKTSVAVNLATAFVAENKKVLLIDANFRRPTLHTIFPKPEAPAPPQKREDFGLSSLLTGRCGYQDVIRTSGIEGLWLIDSGPLPSNPAELLGSSQMEELIKLQRESYDYVIVDGPPVLLVSDAKVLAKLVDGTVLVFNAGATRRGAAQRTIREMKEVNTTIAGCVLFAVKAMKGGYFQEQFRSYREYQKLQLARSV